MCTPSESKEISSEKHNNIAALKQFRITIVVRSYTTITYSNSVEMLSHIL